jgi:ArsR family transcriptional regulator
LCVNALSNQLGVSQSAVSQHLRVLRQVGLVRSKRLGSFARYTLNRDVLEKYGQLVRDTLEEIGFYG